MPVAIESFEAVRNSKTKKFFIVLDELGERYRLINPEGEYTSLPIGIFEDEPDVFDGEVDYPDFTQEQVEKYNAFVTEQNVKADLDHAARQVAKERNARTPVVVEPKRKVSTGSRRKNSTMNNRIGLGATWTASCLVFYRPQIDKLGPKQTFKIEVDGVGSFVMSKSDFQREFADVVLSAAYKSEGYFSYGSVPDKAMKFLKTND